VIYLASPYSHPAAAVKDMRYREACRAAGRLMREGHAVFSPIAHSHPIEQHFDGAAIEGHDFWLKQDFAILRHASRLVVLMLEGWDQSYGVGREIELAQALHIPVEYLEPRP
jgi:hypothetical protein